MTASSLALTLSVVTFCSTGTGGAAAIRLRDRLHLLLGFSSGAVLAVALFDILPEVFSLVPGMSTMTVTALGFLAFFALERYTALHRAREHPHRVGAHEQEMGVAVAAGLSAHSFLDGVAIGVGFETSLHLGLLIALGVIVHDFSDGLSTVTAVLGHGNPLRRATLWLLIDMTTPFLGVLAALLISPSRDLLPWILAFFAGSFLYIGASDLLPEAREHDSPMVGIATALGIVVIYVATRMLPN